MLYGFTFLKAVILSNGDSDDKEVFSPKNRT